MVPAAALLAGLTGALRQRARATSAFFLLGTAVFVLLTAVTARRCYHPPDGDEPWYFAMGDSLVQDGDLELSAAEVEARSPWYYGKPLRPDQLTTIHGRSRTTHWPLLSAVLLPACWLRSVFLARLELALLISTALGLGARSMTSLWDDELLGLLSVGVLFVATPLATFSLLVFPDGVAAAVFLLALTPVVTGRGAGSIVIGGLLAGGLAWLKPSFVLLGLACGLIGLTARQRRSVGTIYKDRVIFAASFAVCVMGFVCFQEVVYGQIKLYDLTPEPAEIPSQLALSLAERGRGLLVHFPACGWVLFGATALAAKRLGRMIHGPSEPGAWPVIAATGLVLAVMVLPACFRATGAMGGWSPPGRYWVPVITALLAVMALERERVLSWLAVLSSSRIGRAFAALTIAAGAMTNLLLALVPQYSFSVGRHWLERFLE
jgi:hypothetical protein